MISPLTWEICDRADQAVRATLVDRKVGGNVQISRHAPRSASCVLGLDDPAADLVTEGDKLLRVKVAGWPDPLFVGRITSENIFIDDESESLTINALDPLQHLARCVLLASGIFSGIRSWQNFNQEQVATMRDLVNNCASNGHGIVVQSGLPLSAAAAANFSDDAAVSPGSTWASPSLAAVLDGNPAHAAFAAAPGSHVYTHYLKALDWGFNVPTSATIIGISAEVACWTALNSSNTSGNQITRDYSVRLVKGGVISGADRANLAEWALGNTYRNYGSAGDLWSLSLTPADVNASNFGFVISAESFDLVAGFGISADWYIDHMRLTVWWQSADGEIYSSPGRKGFSFPAGSVVADNLNSIVAQAGAPEYEIAPKQATNGDLATMKIFLPRQGSDKHSTVICKIGVDATDNCTELSYDPTMDAMVNRFTAIGDVAGSTSAFGLDWPTHIAIQASHAASIAQYGVWEASEALAGVTDASILQNYARGMVAANAYPVGAWAVTLDPESGLTFSPTGDFWMGDKIHLTAHLPEETLELDGRVSGATLTEDENGDVEVAINVEPDHFNSGVATTTLSVVVDSQDGQVPPAPEPPPQPETPQKKSSKGTPKKKRKKKRH